MEVVCGLPSNIRTSPKRSTACTRRRRIRSYGRRRSDAFANALGGFGGTIVGFGADEKLISYVSPDSAEIAEAYARGGWADHNFRIQLGAPLIRAGREFVHERMLLDRRGLERQRIQIEFLNAFQLRSFIGFEFVPGEIGGCVERGTAEVEDWEISELERVNHHIKRIGAIASARGAMFAKGIETGLDHLRAGAILLDRRGRIVSMNARAASIRDRLFHIQSGQLTPRDTEMAGAFGRMLQGVSAAGHAHEIGPDAAIRLRCADGSSFLARAAPLVGPAIDIFMRARILLLLTPLQAAGFESVDRLRTCVWIDARRSPSGRMSGGRRRPRLSGDTLGRVAGNAARRPQGDLPEDRRETSGRACRASDADRHLATEYNPSAAFSSHLGGAARFRTRLTHPHLTSRPETSASVRGDTRSAIGRSNPFRGRAMKTNLLMMTIAAGILRPIRRRIGGNRHGGLHGDGKLCFRPRWRASAGVGGRHVRRDLCVQSSERDGHTHRPDDWRVFFRTLRVVCHRLSHRQWNVRRLCPPLRRASSPERPKSRYRERPRRSSQRRSQPSGQPYRWHDFSWNLASPAHASPTIRLTTTKTLTQLTTPAATSWKPISRM